MMPTVEEYQEIRMEHLTCYAEYSMEQLIAGLEYPRTEREAKVTEERVDLERLAEAELFHMCIFAPMPLPVGQDTMREYPAPPEPIGRERLLQISYYSTFGAVDDEAVANGGLAALEQVKDVRSFTVQGRTYNYLTGSLKNIDHTLQDVAIYDKNAVEKFQRACENVDKLNEPLVVYNKACALYEKARDHVVNLLAEYILAARERGLYLMNIRYSFNRYLEMADNAPEIALRFLVEQFPGEDVNEALQATYPHLLATGSDTEMVETSNPAPIPSDEPA